MINEFVDHCSKGLLIKIAKMVCTEKLVSGSAHISHLGLEFVAPSVIIILKHKETLVALASFWKI